MCMSFQSWFVMTSVSCTQYFYIYKSVPAILITAIICFLFSQ